MSDPDHDSPITDCRAVAAEFIGTAFLLAGVIGSGIMGTRLTDDVGVQLLVNAVATALLLGALIAGLAPLSGAHFNPAVTLWAVLGGRLGHRRALGYVAAQVCGAIVGVVAANVMFDEPWVALSTTERADGPRLVSEAVATFGLLLVIASTAARHSIPTVAASVGGYIGAAYFFTSSTSFANPAVTVARALSDTFAGIEPASVPAFVLVQLAVAGLTARLIDRLVDG